MATMCLKFLSQGYLPANSKHATQDTASVEADWLYFELIFGLQ